MSIIIPANSAAAAGSLVTNSLRFNSASSDYLTRTPSSATNRKTCTLSVWVKRSGIGDRQTIMAQTVDGSNETFIWFDTNDELFLKESGEASYELRTNRKFRDPSAWYHIVMAIDTTQSSGGNRIKLYINGVQETSVANATDPSLNDDTRWNSTTPINIGRINYGSEYYGGYLSELVWIDGQALAPTSFGEFDGDSNIWKPIDVSGLTFGTNGFYLQFKKSGTGQNASGLGADTSGNTHHFAVNNLTAVDQSTDNCQTNFATWNPLVKTNSTVSLTNGNLIGSQATNASYYGIVATMFPTSGKWYAEMKFTSLGTVQTGFITEGTFIDGDRNLYSSSSSLYWQSGSTSISTVLKSSGVTTVVSGGSNSTSAFNSTNDLLMYAWDVDNGRAWFGINGTWQNSGNPAGPTNWWSLPSDYADGVGLFTTLCGCGVGTATVNLNTGSAPFAISSGNSDGDGFGNFEYAVPSGYFALNTKNLAEYG
tara:strand:+ start:281 stop:1723 length:1443 start_codon:yes stop_codon:yes gene_type:complete